MKKILTVLFTITISISAFAVISPYAGGWNYVYAAKTGKCLQVHSRYISAGYFLNNGCVISNLSQRHGTVMVLDCRDHPTVKGYVWYARSRAACIWIQNIGVR